MRLALPLVPTILMLAACGSPPPSKTPEDVKVATVDPSTVPVAPPATRGPSKEILAKWPFGTGASVVYYADVAGIASTELAKGLVPALLAMKEIPDAERGCATALFAGAKEVLAASGGERGFVVVRVDGDAVQTACGPTLTGARPTTVAGATAAFERSEGTTNALVAFQPGWVIVGDRPHVEAALAGRAPSAAPSITLKSDELAVVVGRDERRELRGALTINDERFRLTADVGFGSEDEAKGIEAIIDNQRGALVTGLVKELQLPKAQAQIIERSVAAFGVARTGNTLAMKFDLVEKPVDQAFDLGALSASAISSVRKYLVKTKQVEVKTTLREIGRDVVSWYEADYADAKGKLVDRSKKRLSSIAPTPNAIPKGVKYQSSPEDWKPWEQLKFEMSSPQYYQYEVKASKDGKSADIIARGDLNGDGKSSTFALKVTITPDHHMVLTPQIAETDPDE